MSFLHSQFLVVFLPAVKVQSRNVSLIYAGPCKFESDNYLRVRNCSATKTSLNDNAQCEARADGSTKGGSKVKTIGPLSICVPAQKR